MISNVLENIGTKKMFTKMDLRWGYNNMRIKEGDEWKAAFTMQEGLFEPMVMFFGLTNSPATFQTMMNELLRDLINIEKVATFIDDVIVRMETEEVLWDTWNMNNFYFYFLLFSDFIGFCFVFFLFWMMKRYVTSQSHDVMS